MCGEDPRASLLTTIPGVGYYIALLLVAEIGDVNRFPDSESLCSYAGLVPSVWQSGGARAGVEEITEPDDDEEPEPHAPSHPPEVPHVVHPTVHGRTPIVRLWNRVI